MTLAGVLLTMGGADCSPRENSVRCAVSTLPSCGRVDVIVKTSVLIMSNEDDRIFPVRPVADCIHDFRDMGLPPLNVRRWMFIIFENF